MVIFTQTVTAPGTVSKYLKNLRARGKITASDGAEFLFVRKAREGAHTQVCNASRNAADGQKDKQDDAFILPRALMCFL